MQINVHNQTLPQMNSESAKRDKTLDKIAAARELGMEDSASRSIASQMQNDISTFSQGFINANDGIAMMQIADGALSSLSDQTQLLNDLSVRNNSAILNSADKQALESQFQRTQTSMQSIIDTTSFNEKPLFGTNFSFSLGEGSLSASIGNVSPKNLTIDNQDGIAAYAQTLLSAQSDVGSSTNNFISSANELLGQITQASAAKSQIADTDMAKTIREFQRSDLQLTTGQLAMAHNTQILQQSIGRLLG